MTRVIADYHEGFDAGVASPEQLQQRRKCHRPRVIPPEQGLLQQPFVKHDFEANAILDTGFSQEFDDFFRVCLDKPSEYKDQRLDD